MPTHSSRLTSVAVAVLGLSPALARSHTGTAVAGRRPDASVVAAALGGYFTENRGQLADESILYYGRLAGLDVGFAKSGVLVAALDAATGCGVALRISFPGSRPVEPVGLDPRPHRTHVLRGDRSRWRTDLSSFAAVSYPGLHDGVDLVLHGAERGLEYEIRLGPAADPDGVELAYEGVDGVAVHADGRLVLETPLGRLVEEPPVAFAADGRRLRSRFVARGPGRVGIAIDGRPAGQGVVVDPILWSTFAGGGDRDEGHDIAVDAAGNAYVAGTSTSADFPTTTGAFDRMFDGPAPGTADGVVFKLSADGSTLLFSTFLGGERIDEAWGIAVDSFGAAYVTGNTFSNDFPTTDGAYNTKPIGVGDAFVSKLSADGSTLVYSTRLGGSSYDVGRSIALGADRTAYVFGYAGSNDYPITPGAFEPGPLGCAGGADGADNRYFVTHLDVTGGALLYSTLLACVNEAVEGDVAVNQDGFAYVAFGTDADFAVTPGVWDESQNGGNDAIVVKLDPVGSAPVYATYLGGSDFDHATSIALGAGNQAFVAGFTKSTDFPFTADAMQKMNAGVTDGFAAELDATGATLVYSTYFGGSTTDSALAIAVDLGGHACATGLTLSTDFPLSNMPIDDSQDGSSDAFVIQLDTSGGLLHSTFLGDDGLDEGTGIALAGNAILVTGTAEAGFPTTLGAYDPSFNGVKDAFVTKLKFGPVATKVGCQVPVPDWIRKLIATSTLLDLGRETYEEIDLIEVMRRSSHGDASVFLARELAAAKLNLGLGLYPPDPVLEAIDAGDLLLAKHCGRVPYRVRPGSAEGRKMTEVGELLQKYNEAGCPTGG